MNATIEINEANFDSEVLNSPKPVLVDFWAEWCGPCKMLTPVLEEVAAEQANTVQIGKVNMDQNPALASRFGIQAIPTLLYFNKGEVRNASLGVQSKRAIIATLESLDLAA